MTDGMGGAGISAKERLARIETVLDKIDRKLDHKADKADVVALELRVRRLEQAHIGCATLDDVGTLRGAVEALQRRAAYMAGGIAAVVLLANFAVSVVHKL